MYRRDQRRQRPSALPLDRDGAVGRDELDPRDPGRERDLVAVFLYQVPYTNHLASIRAIEARLLELSQQVRRRAGGFVQPGFSDATLHLAINLVSSTIMQLVFEPPAGVEPRDLLDELTRRVEEWIRGSTAERTRRNGRRSAAAHRRRA